MGTRIAALRPLPHYEFRRANLVLGTARDSGSRGVVCPGGTARSCETARIRFAKIATATFGNGKSFPPYPAIWSAHAGTWARDRQPGPAAIRLHRRRCEA